MQNDSDSGEEFDLVQENDPLFDSGGSFELVTVPGIQPTPLTLCACGVIACAPSQHDTNKSTDSILSSKH